MTEAELVIVAWEELCSADKISKLQESLEKAFGPDGIGIIGIRGYPDFVQAKQIFLPLAYALVNLPHEYLENELTDKSSLYNSGWSHGKEKLGNTPDMAKGSFYFNPVTDVAGSAEDRDKYPLSYPKNVWPDKLLPEFQQAGKRIGLMLKDATVTLCRHIDALATNKLQSYPPDLLYKNMKDTDKVKARLLYYFPIEKSNTATEDSWIGWHNDSGFLTALAGEMYVDHATGQPVACPDPMAGLYIVDRHDRVRRVCLPEDCMAVQIGECTQIVTGGAVTATPHCVRGANMPGIARISLPCFVDTPPTFSLAMPSGCSRDRLLQAGSNSSKVPPLSQRWDDQMTFGDFLQRTFAMYYDLKK